MVENKELVKHEASGPREIVWLTCSGCRRELEPEKFGVDRSRTSQRNPYCKDCVNAFAAERRRAKVWAGTAVCITNPRPGRSAFSVAKRKKLDKIEKLGGVVWIETPMGMYRWHKDFRYPVYSCIEEWMQAMVDQGIRPDYPDKADLQKMFAKESR